MLVQINTDSNIHGHENMARRVEDKVKAALSDRFGERLTRVEVHLGDENSNKKEAMLTNDACSKHVRQAFSQSRSAIRRSRSTWP